MGSPKHWGIIKANKLRKSVFDVCEKWNKANAKNMPVNRLIAASCEGNHYKKEQTPSSHLNFSSWRVANVDDNEGAFLPLLIPSAVLAAEATRRKKKQVGNICRGKWAADKRRVWRTLRRTGLSALAKLAIFK